MLGNGVRPSKARGDGPSLEVWPRTGRASMPEVRAGAGPAGPGATYVTSGASIGSGGVMDQGLPTEGLRCNSPCERSHAGGAALLADGGRRLAGAGRCVARIVEHVRLDERVPLEVRARDGLDGGSEKTLEEVGEKFGVTRERVRQIQNIALNKLRRMIEKLEAKQK